MSLADQVTDMQVFNRKHWTLTDYLCHYSFRTIYVCVIWIIPTKSGRVETISLVRLYHCSQAIGVGSQVRPTQIQSVLSKTTASESTCPKLFPASVVGSTNLIIGNEFIS